MVKKERYKRFLWLRLIIVTIGLLLFATGTIIWILNTGHIIQGEWSYILPPVFTFIGVALSF